MDVNYLNALAIVPSLILMAVLFFFMRDYRLKKHFQKQATTLSTMYKAIPDLVYCMDMECRFTNCNRSYEEFTGFSESEVVGKTDVEIYTGLLDEKTIQNFMEINRKVVGEGKTISMEETHARPNGATVLLKSTKTPLVQNGKIIGLLGISRDITEHRAAEEAAYAASRAKSSFLAKMSHEIRTPMNAILGMTELALREKDSEAARKHVITVKQAGTHLLSIINDILDFSKIEMRKLEIIPGDYSFSSLVNDVINIIRMRLIDSQLRFAVFIDSKIPEALIGDETRIRQILLNVLNNAVKYSEKGFVSLAVRGEKIDENNIRLIIEIMDSGKGIKQEDIKNLFDEYVQFDQIKNKNTGGVGLGLAITRNIVEAMNGNISVYSEYGKGSLFTVSVPQAIHSWEPMASVGDCTGKSVLIYERRDIYANSIICAIENLGVGCTRVSSNKELYEQLTDKTFTFIFISFPLFERNKKTIAELGANTKVVVITEFGEIISGRHSYTLSMPAYSLSIANVLNGAANNFTYYEDYEHILNFTAPDAKILIVDDIYTNLKVAEGLLLPYKVQIDMCTGGREAIEAVIFKRYDLIFMDHKMPDMDGIEAALNIRKMAREDLYYKNVPIIAFTANAVSGTREMFLESGFDDFMSKPIDTIKLNAILRKWIPKEKQKNTQREGHAPDLKNGQVTESGIEIRGLDVDRGIFLSGGTKELYMETLVIFYKDGLQKINDIRSCLEAGNLPLYVVHVHALKSASANIGAGELSETAECLEMAGERNDLNFIQSSTAVFLEDMESLLKNIHDFLSAAKGREDEEKGSFDKEMLKPALFELKTALDKLDAGNMNRIIENLRKMPVASEIGAAIENVSEEILVGGYDEAAALVDTLLLELSDGTH